MVLEVMERLERQLIGKLERAHYHDEEARLLKAVNDALARIPCYQQLGYPTQVQSLAAFQDLPVLERSTLEHLPPSALLPRPTLCLDALRQDAVTEVASSGSRGFVRSWMAAEDGALMPTMHVATMGVASSALEHTALLTSPICTGNQCDLAGTETWTLLPTTPDVFREPPSYMERVAAAIAGTPQPSILLANPVLLAQAACRAQEERMPLRFEGAIMSAYQRLSHPVRRFLSEFFGAPIFEQYGASELAGCYVSNTCRRGTPHVWASNVYVEVLNDDGEQAKPGEVGDIVLTNIGARGTTLLRYRVGDLGRVTTEPCDCGFRASKALRVDGRRRDAWRVGGTLISERHVDDALSEVPGLLFYQCTVMDETAVRVAVVPRPGETVPASEVSQAVAQLGFTAVTVSVTDRICVDHSEKYPHLRNWYSRYST